jgi:hypothetical protein
MKFGDFDFDDEESEYDSKDGVREVLEASFVHTIILFL